MLQALCSEAAVGLVSLVRSGEGFLDLGDPNMEPLTYPYRAGGTHVSNQGLNLHCLLLVEQT